MAGQYLTAVFKLRPSRRKAAIMEKLRAKAEDVFWDILAQKRPRADVVAAEADKKARREQSRALEQEIARDVIRDATKAGYDYTEAEIKSEVQFLEDEKLVIGEREPGTTGKVYRIHALGVTAYEEKYS